MLGSDEPFDHDCAGITAGRLKGKVALITGASRGIGRAICLGFARERASVVVNYLNSEREALDVSSRASATAPKSFVWRADVSREEEVQAMVRAVVDEMGRLDVLVNNAGIILRAPFLEIPATEWDQVIAVNLRGSFLCAREAARHMARQGGGVIINISSTASERPSRLRTPYCVSKAGVTMLTNAMGLELACHNIRVNAIAPGTIETDMNREALENSNTRAARLQTVPLRRLGQAQDVVEAAIYLASDAASYVTGCTIVVDGGQRLEWA